MESRMEIKLTIDGKEVAAEDGTTILDAASRAGIRIPTLCHHPDLSNWGGCRICMVEVDGAPRLAASCVTPVRNGMEVVTDNDRIRTARRTVLEFLFAERNHFCMFCSQSGDCELQSLAYELQMDHLTVPPSYQEFPVDATDDFIVIDHNRCILCGRCVRACHEIAGSYILNYRNRGSECLIVKDLGDDTEASSCMTCGVCLQVCPTGAIFDRHRTHYAVKGKAKDWECVESLCPQCGLLCPTVCYVKDNNLLKIEGVMTGGRPDRGQLCRMGRFGPLMSAGKRLLEPKIRVRDGNWSSSTWEEALDFAGEKLLSAKEKGKGTGNGDDILGLISADCSNEELLLFKDVMTGGLGAGAVYALETSTETESEAPIAVESSWRSIPKADLILLVGADPKMSQPVIASLIRRTVIENKTGLVLIGSEDTMEPWTDLFLPVKSMGTEVIGALVKAVSEMSKSSEFESARRLDIQGLDKNTTADILQIAGLFHSAKNPVIIVGDELTDDGNPALSTQLMKMASLKGPADDGASRLLVLKPSGNCAAALKLGLKPANGSGKPHRRRAGILFLSEETAIDPRWIRVLDETEFLVVVSPFETDEMADRARVLIPKPHWLEDEGDYTSVDGRETAYKNRVLKPPEGVRPGWETLSALAGRVRYQPEFGAWSALCKRSDETFSAAVPASTT